MALIAIGGFLYPFIKKHVNDSKKGSNVGTSENIVIYNKQNDFDNNSNQKNIWKFSTSTIQKNLISDNTTATTAKKDYFSKQYIFLADADDFHNYTLIKNIQNPSINFKNFNSLVDKCLVDGCMVVTSTNKRLSDGKILHFTNAKKKIFWYAYPKDFIGGKISSYSDMNNGFQWAFDKNGLSWFGTNVVSENSIQIQEDAGKIIDYWLYGFQIMGDGSIIPIESYDFWIKIP